MWCSSSPHCTEAKKAEERSGLLRHTFYSTFSAHVKSTDARFRSGQQASRSSRARSRPSVEALPPAHHPPTHTHTFARDNVITPRAPRSVRGKVRHLIRRLHETGAGEACRW